MEELARLKRLISRHSGEAVTRTALPGVSVLRAPRAHRAQRHFRAVTSMIPIQFQKQFSREYRRMFGVPPSRDALALRKTAVLP